MKFIKALSLLCPLSLIISSQIYTCDHNYIFQEYIKENDCTNPGVALYICLNCNSKKEVDVEPDINKHNWKDIEILEEATCIKRGLKKCKCRFNKTHEAILETEFGPHDLSNHFDHQFPTFRMYGFKEHYVCPICDNYLLHDGKTVVQYCDIIINKYDSTKLDFVEKEIEELSLKYNSLIEEDIVYIKNIYIDMSKLNEIEKYYLKKEKNKIMEINYHDSFLLIVNKYNSLFIN